MLFLKESLFILVCLLVLFPDYIVSLLSREADCDFEERLLPLSCYHYFPRHLQSVFTFPVLVEEISINPPIKVFHNVAGDNTISTLISQAKYIMQPSAVRNINGSEVTDDRVSMTASVHYTDNEIIGRLVNKLGLITGLDTQHCENLQVNYYQTGGYYKSHYDFASKDEVKPFGGRKIGNRIATVLIYLNDVKAGGETAFPLLRLKVSPKKGSALFWYNLDGNGNPDERTLHTACPVINGEKWAANLWFHEVGQEFRKPCPTRIGKR